MISPVSVIVWFVNFSNAKVAAAISRFNAKKKQAPVLPVVDLPADFNKAKKRADDLVSFAEKE